MFLLSSDICSYSSFRQFPCGLIVYSIPVYLAPKNEKMKT